eukprot:5527612-Pyramimonas_sp.AAC.1
MGGKGKGRGKGKGNGRTGNNNKDTDVTGGSKKSPPPPTWKPDSASRLKKTSLAKSISSPKSPSQEEEISGRGRRGAGC